jgi:hypothetical protein
MTMADVPQVSTEPNRHSASLAQVLRTWWMARRDGRALIRPVEEQVHAVDQWAASAPHRLAVRLILIVLVVSVVLTIVDTAIDLNVVVPWLTRSVAVVSALLTLVQGIDWLWPNSFMHRFRTFAERPASKIVTMRRRQRLRRLLAVYGREELAQRLLSPEQARPFTVAAQRSRRRRYQWGAALSVIVLAVSGVGYAWSAGQDDKWHRIGEQFALDGIFKMTVTSGPTCQLGEPEYVGRVCTI